MCKLFGMGFYSWNNVILKQREEQLLMFVYIVLSLGLLFYELWKFRRVSLLNWIQEVIGIKVVQYLIRMDMDVNEHGRLSNFTLETKLTVKEHKLYCCYPSHNHRKVFNNEHSSYTNMSVKRSLAISLVFTSVDKC